MTAILVTIAFWLAAIVLFVRLFRYAGEEE